MNGFKNITLPLFWDEAAAGGTPAPAKEPDAQGQGGTPKTKQVVFNSQEELDALFADRAKRASQSALEELVKKSGVKDVETLIQLAQEGSKAQAAQLSELEKAQAASTDLQAKLNTALALSAELQKQLDRRDVWDAIRKEAAALPFLPEAMDDILKLLDGDETIKLTRKEDGLPVVEGVKDAVAKVAESRPWWLVKPEQSGQRLGTPPKPPKKGEKQEPAPAASVRPL